jgi:hypothetical protein
MIFRYAAIIVLSFVAAAAVAAQGRFTRTATKTETLLFGAGGTVAIIGAPMGSINISAAAGNQIEIVAEVSIQANNEADLATLANVIGFAVDDGRTRAGIVTLGPHNRFGGKKLPKDFPKRLVGLPFRIDYNIKVPRYCDLEIDVGEGDLTVSGIEGSVRLNAVKTRARVELAGTLTAVISSGQLELSPDQRAWRGRPISVSLASGTIMVDFPTRASADVTAKVLRTGTVVNSISELKPRDRRSPFTTQTVAGTLGVGGPQVLLTVGDGSITLRQRAAR